MAPTKKMIKVTPAITCAFVDIGGVLLTEGGGNEFQSGFARRECPAIRGAVVVLFQVNHPPARSKPSHPSARNISQPRELGIIEIPVFLLT